MKDWVALGGGNSGCCGDQNHKYGFHLAGGNVPVTDYSRSHEPGKPYNMSWACAGDFSHKNNAKLRAMHADLITRLVAGDPALHMICEFIGQPWAGKPVYYWCRWENVLMKYTGSGHDTWSHISWWRSKANLRAYLWVPTTVPVTPSVTPTPAPTPTVTVPKYPGYVMKYNPNKYDANFKTWQAQMKKRGWRIVADGYFGDDSLGVVKAFQKEKKLTVDGKVGAKTWAAAWTAAIT